MTISPEGKPKSRLDEARRYWREAQVDPTEVAFGGESIRRAEPSPEELERLAAALARARRDTDGIDRAEPGRSAPEVDRFARAMLMAALGTTVTQRILDKSQLRGRWSKLLSAVATSPKCAEVALPDAVRVSKELGSPAAARLRDGLERAVERARRKEPSSDRGGPDAPGAPLEAMPFDFGKTHSLILSTDACRALLKVPASATPIELAHEARKALLAASATAGAPLDPESVAVKVVGPFLLVGLVSDRCRDPGTKRNLSNLSQDLVRQRLSAYCDSQSATARARSSRPSKEAAEHFDKIAAEAKAGGLSPDGIAFIARDYYPRLDPITQRRVDELHRQLEIKAPLRDLLKNAKDAAYLRDVPVGLLLRDEALFLDAFDVFVEANDKALKLIADMTRFASASLQDGREFEYHSSGASLNEMTEQLASEVSRMLDWLEALSGSKGSEKLTTKCKAAFETVADELTDAAENLQRVFAMGYQQGGGFDFHQDLASGLVPGHVAKPYNDFIGICSKSKATVTADSIKTVEELIRVLHREVASAYGEHVKDLGNEGLTLKKSHKIKAESPNHWSRLSLTYVGDHTEESLAGTPMGKVRDALTSCIQSWNNADSSIDNGVLTDKTLAFDLRLGFHTGRLNVTFDASHDLYFVEWGMQEPGDGKGRLEFCPSYFAQAGFEHSIQGWKHCARKKVSPDDIHRAIWFMSFSLENMKNVDICTPVLDQRSLYRMFESWYDSRNPTRPDGPRLAERPEDVLAKFPSWGEAEAKILELMLADPHVFKVAEIDHAAARGRHSQSSLRDAFAVFVADHAKELLAPIHDVDQAAKVFGDVASVYFDAVQPLLMKDLADLDVKGCKRENFSEQAKKDARTFLGTGSPEERSTRLKAGSTRQRLIGPKYQTTTDD